MAGNGANDSTSRRRAQSREGVQELQRSATAYEDYLIAQPQRKNPFSYIYNMLREGNLTQTSAPKHVYEKMNNTTTLQERLAMFLMQALRYVSSPLAIVGHVLEVSGNTIIANGGLIKTLWGLLYSSLFLFKKGTLVVRTDQNSAEFLSIVGLMDPRKDLYVPDTVDSTASDHPESSDHNTSSIFPGAVVGARRIADVMLMAAKFAYENEVLIKEVVTNSWQMNFVGVYNCWNENQKRFNKQVYIFTDKAQDANAIVVAWRGTDPFNAEDWITDVDFSWYNLQGNAGRVHVGFLECLGLGDRHDMTTFAKFSKNWQNKKEKKNEQAREFQPEGPTQISPSPPASGLPQEIIDESEKILAYDDITKVVKGLLEKNPKAKLFITGHSLGGALAVLYTGMLYYFGEDAVTERIDAVYTFGQPRVGDKNFCQFMSDSLKVEKYFRVVYCNDIVPRLPFNDTFFAYQHWGLCYYFSSLYVVRTMREVPNPNFFSIDVWNFFSVRVNAVYELISSLFIACEHGPTYEESLTSFLYRVLGLFFPGFAGHSPVNYCNGVRLGKPMPLVANLD